MKNKPWIDIKYIGFVLPHIELSKQTGPDKWVGRCPVCGDSQKNRYKTRFNISPYKGQYRCSCYNCDYNQPLGIFLRDYHPSLYKDYLKETFTSEDKPEQQLTVHKKTKGLFKPSIKQTGIQSNIIPVKQSNVAESYLKRRGISEDKFKHFAVTYNFKKLLKDAGYKEYDVLKDDEIRLVVPLFDINKKLTGFQGRLIKTKISESELRYITIRLVDEAAFIPIDIDLNKTVYVLEGIYDALTLENGVAALNSNLIRMRKLVPDAKLVYVFDNEPYNKAIVKQIKKAINTKADVFIPDSKMLVKDLNKWLESGISKEEIQSYVESRTFSYPMSLLEFNKWKKV